MIYSLKRFASLLLTIAVSVSQVSAATYTKSDYQVSFELNIGPFFASDHTPEAHVQTPGLNRSAAIVVGTEAVLITGIMASLYSSWYSGTETGGFHFYNDNREWLMMDKMGHANSCYNFANIGYEALVMTGLDERRSLLYGAPLGITIMTMVEVFDGLSGQLAYLPDDARQRRLFLAPDIDISRIPCRNKTLKHVLRVLSAIKLPTPAVEYRPGESRLCWHWLYF